MTAIVIEYIELKNGMFDAMRRLAYDDLELAKARAKKLSEKKSKITGERTCVSINLWKVVNVCDSFGLPESRLEFIKWWE